MFEDKSFQNLRRQLHDDSQYEGFIRQKKLTILCFKAQWNIIPSSFNCQYSTTKTFEKDKNISKNFIGEYKFWKMYLTWILPKYVPICIQDIEWIYLNRLFIIRKKHTHAQIHHRSVFIAIIRIKKYYKYSLQFPNLYIGNHWQEWFLKTENDSKYNLHTTFQCGCISVFYLFWCGCTP